MSERRALANRRNALKSTGPRTQEGKARCRMNGVKHGLQTHCLAVLHLEDPGDWNAHAARTIRDLAPVGYLETVLSGRIAALLWRMGRAVRYESEVVSEAMRKAGEEPSSYSADNALVKLEEDLKVEEEGVEILLRLRALKGGAHVDGGEAYHVLDAASSALEVDLEDDEVGAAIDAAASLPEIPYWHEYEGWTRAKLDAALGALRSKAEEDYREEDPWDLISEEAKRTRDEARAKVERRAPAVERSRRTKLLPDDGTIEKVSRYEASLERSLFKTLHELQRLQAARSGVALSPPASVDLEVNVHGEAG